MKHGFFITGTDTGVGKTWVTTLLLDDLRALGKHTLALKPVASGVSSQHGMNEDAYLLMHHATIKSTFEEINPYCFMRPIAPSLAAKQEKKSLHVDAIWQACQPSLQKPVDVILIEGVGGWSVPLNDQETTADLAKKFGFPIILVVGLRLGCLNHALLTAQAIRAVNLPFAGWIANQVDPHMESVAENIEVLKHFLQAPFLGFVPFLQDRQVGLFDFSLLFVMPTRRVDLK
jgi:dethiobiotin synthetase